MRYAHKLLEQARIKGKLTIQPETRIRDALPFIYTGEGNGLPYYNSGGRSILIDKDGDVYKISGVDPQGHLTSRVAFSDNNLLSDVRAAESELFFHNGERKFLGKPFGVYTQQNIENARVSFERLNDSYRRAGIVPPCNLIDQKPIDGLEGAYQMLFDLPFVESDLRVLELIALVEKKLGDATQAELQQKVMYVNRLCGRLVAWTGYAMQTLLDNRLVPTTSSWAVQNMTLHPLEGIGGYGAFRVDHTSTIHDDKNLLDGFSDWINRNYEDTRFPTVRFSFLAEATQIGANHPEIAQNMSGGSTPFQKFMNYYKSTDSPRAALVDVGPIIEAHKKVFHMGRELARARSPRGMEIPEEYLTAIFA